MTWWESFRDRLAENEAWALEDEIAAAERRLERLRELQRLRGHKAAKAHGAGVPASPKGGAQ